MKKPYYMQDGRKVINERTGKFTTYYRRKFGRYIRRGKIIECFIFLNTTTEEQSGSSFLDRKAK